MKDPFSISVLNLADPPAIIWEFHELSPEVIRAQRMAELEQMAKYRYQQMETYKAWSKNPEKTKEDLEKRIKIGGEDIVAGLSPFATFGYVPFEERIKQKPLYKPEPKVKWHHKLWRSTVGSCVSLLRRMSVVRVHPPQPEDRI